MLEKWPLTFLDVFEEENWAKKTIFPICGMIRKMKNLCIATTDEVN
jgi:hypothetical protein